MPLRKKTSLPLLPLPALMPRLPPKGGVKKRIRKPTQKTASKSVKKALPRLASAKEERALKALFGAIEKGDAAAVKKMAGAIDFKNQPLFVESDEALPLCHAVKSRAKIGVIRALLSFCDANESDMERSTPLMHAAQRGDAIVVAALLKAGANPRATDAGGRTALMRAVRFSKMACVAALLPVSDANAVSEQHQTALSIAARKSVEGESAKNREKIKKMFSLVLAKSDPFWPNDRYSAASDCLFGALREYESDRAMECVDEILAHCEKTDISAAPLLAIEHRRLVDRVKLGFSVDWTLADRLAANNPEWPFARELWDMGGPQNLPALAAVVEAETLRQTVEQAEAEFQDRLAKKPTAGREKASTRPPKTARRL